MSNLFLKYRAQFLFFACLFVILYGAFPQELRSFDFNFKAGVQAVLFFLLAESALSPYMCRWTRENAMFWRVIHRWTLCYTVFMLFLLFQNAEDARDIMKHLDPDLGKPVLSSFHTYDDNCEFQMANLWDNVDHYFAMHVIGLGIIQLFMRDMFATFMWGFVIEVLELSLQHILPHFRECWWDHLFLDLLITNCGGILIGNFILTKILKWREYDWFGRRGKKSVKDWTFLTSHRHFGCTLYLWLFIGLFFINSFFLNNSLWVPPMNPIVRYRLYTWAFMGSIATRECYEDFATWGTVERLENPIPGYYRWLPICAAVIEFLSAYKFRVDAGHYDFDAPFPLPVKLGWSIFLGLSAIWYLYLRVNKYGDENRPEALRQYKLKHGIKLN